MKTLYYLGYLKLSQSVFDQAQEEREWTIKLEIVGATFSKFDCIIWKKIGIKSYEVIDIL